MTNLGIVFRDIRTNKGLKLKDIADDNLSLSLLSKFELGDSDISATRLLYLLEKLNISFEEFSILIDFRSQEKHEMREINNLFKENNSFSLRKLANKYNGLYKKEGLIKFQHKEYLCEVLANRLDDIPVNKKINKDVWSYLIGVENWGYYELTLFNNLIAIFDDKQLPFLSRMALKHAEFYKEVSSIHQEYCQIILNLITIYIEKNQLRLAKQHLDHLYQRLEKSELLYEKNKLNFLYGIYLIKSGKKEIGIDKAQQAIEILSNLDLHTSANQHFLYLEHIL